MGFVGTFALLSLAPFVQDQETAAQQALIPITAPIQRMSGVLDPETGRVLRRTSGFGADGGGAVSIYDNTCTSPFYLGLDPVETSGGAGPEALGDYGALPADTFPGDAFCTPGCADSYEIEAFEISYCTVSRPEGGTTVELYFWDTPWAPCELGTQPGNNPFGGTLPPTTPAIFNTVIEGLPSTGTPGTLACYAFTIELESPFTLSGSQSFVPGLDEGDKFAWSFSVPTSTGMDGPTLAGDLTQFVSPCDPCQGTIWEVGGQTTNQGTGAGQSNHVFWEDFGGTSVPGGAGDCYFFGSQVPTGIHLELFTTDPCAPPIGAAFCDGSDGALATCPCANPGDADTGCDIAQGTGGVELVATAQSFSPLNRVTLEGRGFPAMTSPSAVVMRASMLDAGAPVVFGDGVRCIDSAIVRMSGAIAAGGTSTHVVGHGTTSGEYFYQLWFRNTPAMFCTPDAFNASSGRSLTW